MSVVSKPWRSLLIKVHPMIESLALLVASSNVIQRVLDKRRTKLWSEIWYRKYMYASCATWIVVARRSFGHGQVHGRSALVDMMGTEWCQVSNEGCLWSSMALCSHKMTTIV